MLNFLKEDIRVERNPLEIKTPEELYNYIFKRNLVEDVIKLIYNNDIGFSFVIVDGRLIRYKDKMYFNHNKEATLKTNESLLVGNVDEGLLNQNPDDLVYAIISKGEDSFFYIGIIEPGDNLNNVSFKMVCENYLDYADIRTVKELNLEIDLSKAGDLV